MIGIIEKELNAFSIIEYIKRKYPMININIWYLKEDIEEGIKKLQKDCKIIIIPSNSNKSILKEKYQNISFINIREIKIDNAYFLEEPQLLKAVEEGNEEKVRTILKTLNIEKNKTILINNLELLWIKPIIQEIYENHILCNIELLLEDLEKELETRKISINQEGKVNIIR